MLLSCSYRHVSCFAVCILAAISDLIVCVKCRVWMCGWSRDVSRDIAECVTVTENAAHCHSLLSQVSDGDSLHHCSSFTYSPTVIQRKLITHICSGHWSLVCFQCFDTRLGGSKGIRSVKTEWWDACVVMFLCQGADLHMIQLMPLPLTVSCCSKSRLVLPFRFDLKCNLKRINKWVITKLKYQFE